jgi:hypothetical protein
MNERQTRRIVRERSEGLCERCGVAYATNVHHRKNRSQGGRWDPANCLHLCGSGTTGCHGYITSTPVQARAGGWTVRSGWDPQSVPVRLAGMGWRLLGPNGEIELTERTA